MIRSARSRPTISAAAYPKVRSAARLTSSTRPSWSIVTMQSKAALRIALLRASAACTACWARQRSTNWEICVPRLSIVASSAGSGSSGAAVANASTPMRRNGKAKAPRTATGTPEAHADGTSSAPAAEPAGHVSAQRSSPSPEPGSQSEPAQPSDSPIAASSPG